MTPKIEFILSQTNVSTFKRIEMQLITQEDFRRASDTYLIYEILCFFDPNLIYKKYFYSINVFVENQGFLYEVYLLWISINQARYINGSKLSMEYRIAIH